MYPDIVGHLATQLEHGSVIVTGTNGKTTTAAMVAQINAIPDIYNARIARI